jgi:hypothetical protein
MDEAERRFRALGFDLTARGHHTIGSINHLAVFRTDYLELLGWDPARGLARPDLCGYPHGLNGLVFAADPGEAVHDALAAAGVPVEPTARFSRPVALPGGAQDARFETTRLPGGAAAIGRVYFCHHFTPDLVWRKEWQNHPNGAIAITRIVIAASESGTTAALFARMFGAAALKPLPGGGQLLQAGDVRIEIVPHTALAAELGDAMPDAAGRSDFMALLGLRTTSLARTQEVLKPAAISGISERHQRLLVPASAAYNVALSFEA